MLFDLNRLNERVLLLKFNHQRSELKSLENVWETNAFINHHKQEGVIETWTTYDTIGIEFNPLILSYSEITSWIQSMENSPKATNHRQDIDIKEVKVQYGTPHSDLKLISAMLDLPANEIISLHSSPTYTVAMMGFMPGIPYLPGIPEELHIPRKTKPKFKLEAGSVAIGGGHAGIYPFSSPGGWYILGHTDLPLIQGSDFTFQPGDSIKFIPD